MRMHRIVMECGAISAERMLVPSIMPPSTTARAATMLMKPSEVRLVERRAWNYENVRGAACPLAVTMTGQRMP